MFTDFCKICGISSNVVGMQFFPIHNGEDETKRLTIVGSMFFQCIFKTFRRNINYPAYLCEACKLRLTEFYKFRQMAIKTQETIFEFLKNEGFLSALTQVEYADESNTFIDEQQDLKIEHISESSEDDSIKSNISTQNNNYDCVDQSDKDRFYETNEFPCSICKKIFKSSPGLLIHRKRVHLIGKSNQDRTFVCNFCGKELSTQFVLKQHEFRHTGVRPLKCKFCDNSYNCRSDLRIHMRMHNNIKKFMCDICGVTLRMKTHLIDHMESHAIDQSYKCQYCSLKLKTRRTLIKHIEVVHLNVGRFACLYCNSTFGGKPQLMVILRHIKIHVRNGKIRQEDVINYAKTEIPIVSELRNNTNLIKIYGKK